MLQKIYCKENVNLSILKSGSTACAVKITNNEGQNVTGQELASVHGDFDDFENKLVGLILPHDQVLDLQDLLTDDIDDEYDTSKGSF